MVNYKLYYFDLRGLAEPLRLLFAAAGVKYEDIRIKKEEWPALKPQMPGGQVPVLEIDGKKHGQTVAIAHYLAEEFGFLGKNNIERLEIDVAGEIMAEILVDLIVLAHLPDGTEKDEKKEKFKETIVLPKLTLLNSMAKNGHFVGNSITLADIGFFNLFEMVFRLIHGRGPNPGEVLFHQLIAKAKEVIKGGPQECFPELIKVIHNVATHEKISKYLKTRPDSW